MAALERGEARAAPRERFRAGNRLGSLDCSAVPASAPGFAPVRPLARGVSVPVDAVSAGRSGRGDGWLGTAGPRRDPPVSSNELWDVYGFGVTLGSLYLGAQGYVPVLLENLCVSALVHMGIKH